MMNLHLKIYQKGKVFVKNVGIVILALGVACIMITIIKARKTIIRFGVYTPKRRQS